MITHARTAVRHPQPQVKVFGAAETGIEQIRVRNRLPAHHNERSKDGALLAGEALEDDRPTRWGMRPCKDTSGQRPALHVAHCNRPGREKGKQQSSLCRNAMYSPVGPSMRELGYEIASSFR